jgi:hypothetical protein
MEDITPLSHENESCFQSICIQNINVDSRLQPIRQTILEKHANCFVLPILLGVVGGAIYVITYLTGYFWEVALIEDPMLRKSDLWLGKGFIILSVVIIVYLSLRLIFSLIYQRFIRVPI